MPTKKKQTDGPRKGAHLMDQFGLGINTKEFESMLQGNLDDDDDDDDADILAELAALDGDVSPPKVTRNKGIVTLSDINKMAAESMQDIPSDEDMSENEDPELLKELNELMSDTSIPTLAPSIPVSTSNQLPVSRPDVHQQPSSPSPDSVTLLKDRISMYTSALSNTDEPSKKRRLTRGIKNLEELLKDAKAGRKIPEDSIPPPVSVRRKEPSSVMTQDQPIPVQVQPPLPERNNVPRQEESPIRSAAPALPPRNIVEKPPGQPPVGAVSVLPPLPPKSSHDTARSPAQSPSSSSSSMPGTHRPQPPQQPKLVRVDQMKHPIPESSGANSTHSMLCERRDQYKSAAMVAKKSGDISTATKYAHVAKQFENVIKALVENKPIDLSKMPPPPPGYKAKTQFQTPTNNNISSQSGHVSQGSSVKEVNPSSTSEEIPNLSPSALKKLYKTPDAPSSVEEALRHRLNKYKTVEEEAKKSGNGGKARRMGRIAKEYENAIKMYKAGKPVNFEELPTPPGFPPIPVNDSKPPSSSTSSSSVTSSDMKQAPMKPPTHPPVAKQQPAAQQELSEQEIRKRAFARRSISSRQEQHIAFLKERMAEYRQAAIQARKNQNMELAKAYLRQVKGFEPMIEAAEGGLPVDLSKVPPPLISDEDREEKFVFVNPEDCTLSGDREEVFKKLKDSLVSQIQMCSTNNKHFTKLGDVLSASRFQTLEQSCIKDLDSLKNALHHGDPVPRFHYETTTFSMVKCNTDLGDNDFELTVVRGIKYNPPSSYSPKDLDTYVKFEFPFPADDPQVHTIETVKDTDSPEYNESIKLQINRKSRAMLRIFEKKSLKFEVFYRRGFLKSDKVLGTVNIKLQSLENKCTVHDSYDLMDGRKSVGGKLEVKLRLRDPLKNKQVEEMKEKILIIDQFLRKKTDENTSSNAIATVNQKRGTVSMEVLRFEKQQLDKQISHLKDNLNQSQLQALTNKSKLLQEKLLREQENLKTKGPDYWKAYIAHIENDMKSYAVEAQVLAKKGDIQKAHVMMTKKKLVEKEIAALKSRIPDV
ncbi:coiled-coil and C2 domain-containing protein 1-like [Octopus bimaculoides]|uniref:C2 domain-containing protein n=1 Tax=Octopus bimaculoides TaxID=37653 RepID=A0A0L8H7L3_OCTBM|nr:coiled-coil and C2 domain-containing protein 1-like [Octopus bimaculoides]|eukprot:XP_014774893.1 PREDICTED: coiled-coil and C2 domain-containing protein 1-like [Octopus bimaculoides]